MSAQKITDFTYLLFVSVTNSLRYLLEYRLVSSMKCEFLPEIKNKTIIISIGLNLLLEMPILYSFYYCCINVTRGCLHDLMKTNKPIETTVVIFYFLRYFSPFYSSKYNFISLTILYLVYIHMCWFPASLVLRRFVIYNSILFKKTCHIQ